MSLFVGSSQIRNLDFGTWISEPGFGERGFGWPGFGWPGFGWPGIGGPGFGDPDWGDPDFGKSDPDFGWQRGVYFSRPGFRGHPDFEVFRRTTVERPGARSAYYVRELLRTNVRPSVRPFVRKNSDFCEGQRTPWPTQLSLVKNHKMCPRFFRVPPPPPHKVSFSNDEAILGDPFLDPFFE